MLVVALLACYAVAVAAVSGHPSATSVDDFEFDANHRLRNHQVLYHGNELCEDTFHGAHYAERMVRHLEEPLLSQFIATSNKNNSQTTCFVVCLEKGVQYEHMLHPLLDQVMSSTNAAFGHLSVPDWMHKHCQAKEVGFLSYLSHDANINWIDDSGKRVPVGVVQPGEKHTVWMGSYLGHRFELTHPDTQEVVGEVEMLHHTLYSLGTQYSAVGARDADEVSQQVHSTFTSEWQRAHRVVRTYTEFGFKKGKIPLDLFASMSAYYYNNAEQSTIEEWGNKGVFVNWWESDVYFLPMPQVLKRYWQSRLKQMVEAWVGVPLELTDIYGMRRYEDGARLLTHVDRERTHATSLIVNIAQGGIRKPWKIEIYDFKDRLHEVDMEPGDIVYYESARCLHGRMQPLDGAYYVNLFSHYRPVGDDSWFLKPNPADNVPQALDIGDCSSDGQRVSCSGPYDVSFLSPKMQTLTSGEDLFRFWQDTAREEEGSVGMMGRTASSNAGEL